MDAQLLIYIIVAIVLAIIIFYTRRTLNFFNVDEQMLYATIFGWGIIIYALLMTFTISSFYQHYTEERDTFIQESTNLTLIYRIIKLGPKSKYSKRALRSIERYTESVINDVVPDLKQGIYSTKSELLYRQMDYDIITYTYKNTNIADNGAIGDILARMSTDQRIKKLSDGIKNGQFLIYILMFLSVFVLLGFWVIKIDNSYIQFIMDISLLVIIFVSIYLLMILNNPFDESPLTLSLSMYDDLLLEIQENKRIEKKCNKTLGEIFDCDEYQNDRLNERKNK